MSNLYLKMRNKVLDISNEKIINVGDVLVSLTYKQGDEIKTIYDVFIRDISNGYVNIDFDGYYTSINVYDILSWSEGECYYEKNQYNFNDFIVNM